MTTTIDNDSTEVFKFGEYNPARAILAPLLKGQPVVLSVATDATQRRIEPFLFLCPIEVFKNVSNLDLSECMGAPDGDVEVLATSANQDYRLVMGMPGGKMQIIDVNNIERNSLYKAGMSMRAAMMLQAELEDLFGVTTEK